MKTRQIIGILTIIFSTTWLWAETVLFIRTQPQSQIVELGENATFSVIAKSLENFTIPLSRDVNIDMIAIEPGTFTMGSPTNEIGRSKNYDETLHEVRLTEGYWLSKYEVTQAQYQAVIGTNPSDQQDYMGEYYGVGNNYPVYYVSWNAAKEFCEKLTEIEKKAGRLPEGYEYTLPTEAQWEYACRAGTTTALNSGKDLTDRDECSNMDEVGWYGYNSADTTHPVGLKPPNAWGFYDMHGNVTEWCLDWEGDYPTSSVIDPVGPSTGLARVIRGGSWGYNAYSCRSAARLSNTPNSRWKNYGFRVALSIVQKVQTENGDNLIYQWYKNSTVINGATNTSYKISSVKTNDMGNYTVKVSNSKGSVTSDVAVLTVIMKPMIITQPESQTIREGNTVTFDVYATGGYLKYQWKKDGFPINGETASSYTISNVNLNDAGSYTVTVSNNVGSVTSDVAVLSIKTEPEPEVLNVQRSVNVTGNVALITLKISNAPKGYFASLEEVWQREDIVFSDISDEGTILKVDNGVKVSWSKFDLSGNYQFPNEITYTASVLEGTSTTVNLNGKLMITTTEGVVETDVSGIMSVTFVVPPRAPVIVKDLESKTVCEGSSVTLGLTVTGSDPLLYQWFKNNSLLTEVNGASYTIPSVSSSDAGTYMVLITNAQGAAMSVLATLTVAPIIPELILERNGNEWKITFTGTLQESSDMESWKNVSGTQSGTYTFTPTEGKRFYRAVQ